MSFSFKEVCMLCVLVVAPFLCQAQEKQPYKMRYNEITWKEKYPGRRFQPYFRAIAHKYEPRDEIFSGFTMYANLTGILPPLNSHPRWYADWGIGFNAGFNWQPASKLPVSIGLEFGYYRMATVTRRHVFQIPISSGGVVIDNFNVPINYEANSGIFPIYPVLRVWTPTPYVQLYAEGIAGTHILSTTSKLIDKSDEQAFSNKEDGTILTENNNFTATYALGFGAGLNINLGNVANLYMGIRYLAGGRAKYFNQETLNQWDVDFSGIGTNTASAGLSLPERMPSKTSTFHTTLGLIIRIP